jgi:DNA-directed RNA polymerase subunit RPC12/RpoP
MPIPVKVRCSECELTRPVELKMEEAEIVCPACGRRMANLQQAEYVEIESVLKKQNIFSYVSIACLVIGIICLFVWVGKTETWISDAKQQRDAGVGAFYGFCFMMLVSLVLAVLASLKRYIIEF